MSELRDNMDSVEAIHALQARSNMQDITLLCYEKDGCPCHRHMVRELVEDPRLLQSKFVPENTNNQKSTPMEIHIANKKRLVIP